MRSEVTNDDELYYESILESIQRHVPEFKSIWDKDDIYPVAFEFGNFLIDNLSTADIRTRGLNFINEALEQGGKKTEDLLVLQIFSLMYENPNIMPEFRTLLSDKGKAIFDQSYLDYKKFSE